MVHYRPQMRRAPRKRKYLKAVKTLENWRVRTGQVELANRRIQPLCHLSGVLFHQLTILPYRIWRTFGAALRPEKLGECRLQGLPAQLIAICEDGPVRSYQQQMRQPDPVHIVVLGGLTFLSIWKNQVFPRHSPAGVKKVPHRFGFFVQRDADDSEIPVLETLVGTPQSGSLAHARPAPGRPKVEKIVLPGEGLAREGGVALDGGQGKRRGFLADCGFVFGVEQCYIEADFLQILVLRRELTVALLVSGRLTLPRRELDLVDECFGLNEAIRIAAYEIVQKFSGGRGRQERSEIAN